MPVPAEPKIYHIVHVDRLPHIVAAGGLLCDADIAARGPVGTMIGMNSIKRRRLDALRLASHPGLFVGACVPFYFCPRSIMLYVIHQANHPELAYRGGQGPIVHLEADLHETVRWAEATGRRWAFTLSNAGSRYFVDHADLSMLDRVDWAAIGARDWRDCKEGKQAEFLVEGSFPWSLIRRVGVISAAVHGQARRSIGASAHRPVVEVRREWYY